MPLQQTSGNATADAYGGGAAAVPNYIEDVFSTYLFTAVSGAQTITNGIDLAGKGGMVWIKDRNYTWNGPVFDTARGATNYLMTQATNAQATNAQSVTSFNSDGFSIGTFPLSGGYNTNTGNYDPFASWTFRKQPKFFDVVTYTGNGGVQTINHSLGSVPGCIIIKATTSSPGATDWAVWHRSIPTDGLLLNSTSSTSAIGEVFARSVTSTSFNVDRADTSRTNENGVTFVAYIFAHNAGGFGLTGTDNVISCGSFTTDGLGNATVSLGYEPQWLLVKDTVNATDWYLTDTMRSWANNSGYNDVALRPNLANADYAGDYGYPTATGFYQTGLNASTNHIYIAIRRGPMKVPTDATTVFKPSAITNPNNSTTTNFPVDLSITDARNTDPYAFFLDRLRGGTPLLTSVSTAAENGYAGPTSAKFDSNTGVIAGWSVGASSYAQWNFQRAPSFFDEVCFSTPATVSAPITQNHNLGVAPELIITKRRNSTSQWFTVCSYGMTASQYVALESSGARVAYGGGGTTTWSATSTTVTLPQGYFYTSSDYVYYLFATCAGVSKVGTYTGNGTTQTINCGFTGGARFVLIKRTDSTGNWYVYDTARGMTTLTDPYLLLNSTAAESATLGSVTTVTTGFAVDASILAAINTNAASYIFLAVA